MLEKGDFFTTWFIFTGTKECCQDLLHQGYTTAGSESGNEKESE